MPVQACQLDGKPGFKFGPSGKCFTYTTGNDASRSRAKQRATNQGLAITGGNLEEKFMKNVLNGVMFVGAGGGVNVVARGGNPDGDLNDVAQPIVDDETDEDVKKRGKRKDSVRYSVHGSGGRQAERDKKRKQKQNARRLSSESLTIVESS